MSGRARHQLNAAELFTMSYRQIELAILAGRCDELLEIPERKEERDDERD